MILYLKKLIKQKLNTNSFIFKKVSGVYFQYAANTSFPYIYIGEFISKDISTKQIWIESVYFKVIIFLRDKNLDSMLQLSEEIKHELNITSIDQVILMKCLEQKLNLHNDGLTQKITMNFKAIIMEEKNDI